MKKIITCLYLMTSNKDCDKKEQFKTLYAQAKECGSEYMTINLKDNTIQIALIYLDFLIAFIRLNF